MVIRNLKFGNYLTDCYRIIGDTIRFVDIDEIDDD
jgi:hypothetical protein